MMFLNSTPVPEAIEPLLQELEVQSATRYSGYDRAYHINRSARSYLVGAEYDHIIAREISKHDPA